MQSNEQVLKAIQAMKIPSPRLFSGPGSVYKLPEVMKKCGSNSVFIVTDNFLAKTDGFRDICLNLRENKCEVTVFDGVVPDPPENVSLNASNLFIKNKCDSIVAFGGGSSIDCAKLCVLIVNDLRNTPNISVTQGFSIKYALPKGIKYDRSIPFVAIPTTAGTGSEATPISVVSFPWIRQKMFFYHFSLIPSYAILDSKLLTSLPAKMSAATGMDALTHAIESYIGIYSVKQTEEFASKAINRIFRHLERTITHPEDLEARQNMLQASFEAGVAFARSSVAYVHAFAHQLGGLIHTPHGLGNGILLPRVLELYLRKDGNEVVVQRLARLYQEVPDCREGLSGFEMASEFVRHVRELGEKVDLPKFVPGLTQGLVEVVCDRAMREVKGFKMEVAGHTLVQASMPAPMKLTKPECMQLMSSLVDSTSKL